MTSPELEQWYRQFAYAVYARCWALLGSKAEAEDALHEVFLRVQRRPPRILPDHPLRWLYRIANNHCFDLLRHRRLSRLDEQQAPAVQEGASLESQRFVSQVLAICRPAVREVAVLYFLDELTQEEVAQMLGCSRKQVRDRLASFHATASQLATEPLPKPT